MRKIAIVNGKVYLERETFTQALYAEDGVIKAVGTTDEIKAMAGHDCEIIDAGGKTVIPGINDAHLHFVYMGIGLSRVETLGCESIEDLIERCKAFREAHPEECKSGMYSMGFNEDLFTSGEKRMPNRYDLDKIATDIPVIMVRACGHIAVTNSKAIEMLDVKPGPLPKGGYPGFDDNGEATGVFYEAAYYPQQLLPEYSVEDYERFFMLADQHAIECGVTSVQSNDISAIVGDLKMVKEAVDNVFKDDRANVRYHHEICYYDIDEFKEDCESGAFFKIGDVGNPKMTNGPLKLFSDGSLGGRTATIRKGYADDPGNYGVSNIEKQKLFDYCKIADEHGIQVCVHVIGDQAIQDTIEAYESVLHEGEEEVNPYRHILMHCQITDREMLERIARDDLIVDYQPIFLDYDIHVVEDRVGKELASTSYAFNTAEELGIHVGYGTDAPVEDINPYPGLYCAVTRMDKHGWPEGGWNPQEKVDIYRAVDAYTIGAAYVEFEEERKGRIKPGFLCDLAILDTDIFTCDPVAIKDTKCDMTIIDGEVVFERA